uniref:uncharacterized protein LOC122595433 isoform X2 n=1 Tax=Erigeron canadensis TaxID=72917 RepID=UPI001CB8D178|nr:uncharacterized protein LOC122595433 isoform X2 [Erigeron canadensis]
MSEKKVQGVDGLDDLRIPLDKIKFGKKLEVQGYGTVFEGQLYEQQQAVVVALKQLNITNLAAIKPKLLDEILRISRFRQHPNVVALVGFCDERSNEIILVYEYVAGGNLEDKMRSRLNTIQRLEICLDAARGLDYLHTGSSVMVHGNIKPSKILLQLKKKNDDSSSSTATTAGSKFEAKVSSFGLSKIVPGGQKNNTKESSSSSTHDDENDIKKTTRKEYDVYCFGVMLLEVLCGVSELVDTDDYQERHVTELVPKRLLEEEQNNNNRLRKIVHFDIRKEIKTDALDTYARIACQCVLENPEARPTMPQVVQQLELALQLQGGEVSYVKIPATYKYNMAASQPDENSKADNNTPHQHTIATEEAGPHVPVSSSVHGESLPSINDKSNVVTINVENRDYEQNNVPPKEIDNSSVITSTNTTEQLNSNKLSTIAHQKEGEDQTTQLATFTESSNGDSNTSQEVQNSGILKSGSRDFSKLPNENQIGDGLEHLRIPFEKITFGKKIDVRGYGSIFEGELDHQPVALRRLNITNLANIKPKLLAEILRVAKFKQHPNLVALIGFCDEKNNEIILVYEYVSSGNLADKMSKHLNTIQRLEICLGAARGIEFLHCGVDDSTPGIIHGDVKRSKILLNSSYFNSSKFEAKVSGFGLTKLLPGEVQIVPKSIDPVYEVTGILTKESDIYSFGVLLLEVLCGVSELVDTDDYQERHVTELVPKRLEQNKLRNIVHFGIRDEVTTECLETYAKIACQCVLKNPQDRPNMAEVVIQLEKALRLQGEEVSTMVGSDGNGLPRETIQEDAQGEDDNGEIIRRDIAEEESHAKITSVIMKPSTGVPTPKLYSMDGESGPDKTHTEVLNRENDNNVLINFNDSETTKEVIYELNSNDMSNSTMENEDDNQSTKLVTFLVSSNSDTSISDHPTKHNSAPDSRNFDNLPYENYDVFKDDLENLRIPFNKIKVGTQIDVRGYGSIFEGEFDNQHVALKRLNITNLSNIKPKLLAEILMIARFRKHPNLVTLIGFCDEKSNEIILVYEYVSSGNLADKMNRHLTTIQRLEICLDAARGLDYLHTGADSARGIIHGSIRLSKILLNSDSTESKFKAKVSGFGLSKQLPGHVQIAPKSTDPMYEVTGKLMKESDVYSFGVLLLEVLCGVPELVDTDDYHERHVTELIPKRLEQNMLRKVVHFDIRDEITTESLETYARIACQCVIKNPEERPTMAEVVVELEKALRLQGGGVSYVQILGSTNSKGVPEGIVQEDVQERDEDADKLSMDIAEEEPEETIDDVAMQGESFPIRMLGSANDESVPDITKDDKKNNDVSTNDPTSNEESIIIVEKEVDAESKIITSSDSNEGEDDNSDMQGQSTAEKTGKESSNSYALKMGTADLESNVIMDDKITETEITLDVQNPAIPDPGNEDAGNQCSVFENEKKPELIVDIRRDTSDFPVNDKLISIEKNQDFVSKRSDSTCSESSNGDDTTPSDSLLKKSPPNGTSMKKTSNGSTSYCCCSWWCYLFDRIVFYGGQFWNELVSCFNRIIGQGSSKSD